MRKRRRLILLLMPIFAILWMFGWGLSGSGDQKARTNHAETEKEPVGVHVASDVSVWVDDKQMIIRGKKQE